MDGRCVITMSDAKAQAKVKLAEIVKRVMADGVIDAAEREEMQAVYRQALLTVIDAVNLKVLKHVPLDGPKPDAARRGEILFHSATLTFQGQFSCASCHPDGGSDGLNWDLTRDGVWWVERGKIAYPVRNLRFNQSMIQMLAPGNVEMVGSPERVGASEDQGSSAALMPALKLRAFTFTSQSEAV